MQTGMGKSFSHATKTKSVLDENNNPLIFDVNKNLYYQPIWKNDSLYIMEFRSDPNDTIHKLSNPYYYSTSKVKSSIKFTTLFPYISAILLVNVLFS